MENFVLKHKAPLAALTLAAALLCGCESSKISVSDMSDTGDLSASVGDNPITVSDSTSSVLPDNADQDTNTASTPSAGTSEADTLPHSPDAEAEIVSIPDGYDATASESVSGITELALSLIGEPFLFGGSAPGEGFDSSGFIYYVLRSNGYVAVPRGLNDQTGFGDRVGGYSDMQAGDIVFFSMDGTRAEFGGIYIGGGIMIACMDEGQTVKEVNIASTFYQDSFYCAARVA